MILRAIVSIYLYAVGIVLIQYIYAKDAGYDKKEMEEIVKYFVVSVFMIGVFSSFMRANPIIPLLTSSIVTIISLNKNITTNDISLLSRVPIIGSIIKDVRDFKFFCIYEVLYRADKNNTLISFFKPKHLLLGNKTLCKTCYLSIIFSLIFDVIVFSLMGWKTFLEKDKLLLLYKYGESMISTVLITSIAGMINYIIIEKRISPPNKINPNEINAINEHVKRQLKKIKGGSVAFSFLHLFVLLVIGCYCVYASSEIKKGQERQVKAKYYERVRRLQREVDATRRERYARVRINWKKTTGKFKLHELYGWIYLVKGEVINEDPTKEFPKLYYKLSIELKKKPKNRKAYVYRLDEYEADLKEPLYYSTPIEDSTLLKLDKAAIKDKLAENKHKTNQRVVPFTVIFFDAPLGRVLTQHQYTGYNR